MTYETKSAGLVETASLIVFEMLVFLVASWAITNLVFEMLVFVCACLLASFLVQRRIRMANRPTGTGSMQCTLTVPRCVC
jgi:hypothetical protein